jgi:hypothetical protein
LSSDSRFSGLIFRPGGASLASFCKGCDAITVRGVPFNIKCLYPLP